MERRDASTEAAVAEAETRAEAQAEDGASSSLEAGTNRVLALWLAAAACVIRPTAALYWLPLAVGTTSNHAANRLFARRKRRA